MELRKINTNDIEAQWAYTTELPTDENGLTNPYNGVSFKEYKEKVLPTLISYEHPVNMPDWFVPETYYYLWDGDCLVGEFRIRHHLTEALRNGAGHIGYSISKKYRGKGYGTAGLKLTLDIARRVVPENEIYLRVNKDNIASQKVMINNGAYRVGEDEDHYFMRIPKVEFKKITDFPRGMIYDILVDAYSYNERNRQIWNANWKETDDFFYDNPEIADKYGLVTCLAGEAIGFVTWDPRKRPEYVEIGHNGIREKHKRHGYGHLQLKEALRRIKEYDGLKRIIVCTNSNLVAPKNYESVGFQLYDRKTNDTESAFTGDYLYYEIRI